MRKKYFSKLKGNLIVRLMFSDGNIQKPNAPFPVLYGYLALTELQYIARSGENKIIWVLLVAFSRRWKALSIHVRNTN